LFMGTLESRKNIDGMLDGYSRLLARYRTVPKLVLAGGADPGGRSWLDTIRRPPLAGHVEHLGYVQDEDRQRVYEGARLLVLPSHEEGFGMPALEAMSLGVPVVVSRRGNLPDLVGDAGLVVAPDDVDSIVSALDRVLCDAGLAARLSSLGRERARQFTWARTARAIRRAFEDAVRDRNTSC
jgi:glycosyltransferase involved in cell wall biosynthesis